MSQSPAPNLVEGIGLHSGQPVKVGVSRGLKGAGVSFIRLGKKVPALVEQVTQTERGTSLAGISVVEHFLSAAFGGRYYDLVAAVEGGELPALDGSALPWIEVFEKVAGQSSSPPIWALKKPLTVEDGGARIEARPYRGFKVDFMIKFKGIGEQRFIFDADKQDYKKEIAPARTFGFIEEIEALRAKGLGLGASTDNALVLSANGFVNEPRFPDEPVRHKVLDLIGDLALFGQPINAEIKAVMSGHKLNIALVRLLRQTFLAEK
ncbi:MAG: UDP-3-O-acyl-N-acetylglucosamine deacetylase [Candidatus Margulisbacteria bacterium]|nr:UDP-3-O-acyl-N-acetylglucosamine deacetylase [Candidatus Margulisiibacteriota bacterium]